MNSHMSTKMISNKQLKKKKPKHAILCSQTNTGKENHSIKFLIVKL